MLIVSLVRRQTNIPQNLGRRIQGFGRYISTSTSILYFGTDEYASYIFQDLITKTKQNLFPTLKNVEVVCPPGKLFSRKKVVKQAPLKLCAESLGVKVHEIPHEGIRNWDVPLSAAGTKFDVAVVVSFGYLIPTPVIDSFHTAINVHPSLLPRHRGASPIQYAIRCNDKATGVSIIELSRDCFDAGRILAQAQLPLTGEEDFTGLSRTLAPLGATLLTDVLLNIGTKLANAKPQDSSAATHAPKVTSATTLIDWTQHTKRDIDCMYRAFAHQERLHATWNGLDVKLEGLVPVTVESEPDDVPGMAVYDTARDAMSIRCSDGWVGFTRLQLPTRKTVSARQFANGFGLSSSPKRSDLRFQ